MEQLPLLSFSVPRPRVGVGLGRKGNQKETNTSGGTHSGSHIRLSGNGGLRRKYRNSKSQSASGRSRLFGSQNQIKMPPPASAPKRSSDDEDGGDHASHPPAKIYGGKQQLLDQKEGNDGDEEGEEFEVIEEEIEVEEEVEVEVEEEVEEKKEEEEEEEEEEDPEEEEEVVNSDGKEADGVQNDVSQAMASVGNNKLWGSHAAAEECEPRHSSELLVDSANMEVANPSKSLTIWEDSFANYEDSKQPKSGKTRGENENLESVVDKEDSQILTAKENSKECGKSLSENKDVLCSSEVIVAETTNPSIIGRKEVKIAVPMSDCLQDEVNGVMACEEEVKSVDMEIDDNEQTSSRFVVSESRTRSLSPPPELKDSNKRSAIVCDFFAKGWCIRGNSCKFLHINAKVDNVNQQAEVDAAAAREDQFDGGTRSILWNQKLPGFCGSAPSSLRKDAGPEGILSWEHRQSLGLHQLDDKHKLSWLQREDLSRIAPDFKSLSSSKNDPGFPASLGDAGMEIFRRNWPAAEYGSYSTQINGGSSLLFHKSLLPGHVSSFRGRMMIASNHSNGNTSSYSSILDDRGCIRGQQNHNSSLDTSLSSTGVLPSQRVATWGGPSISYGNRDYHASRSSSSLQSASPLLSSEPGKTPPINASADPPWFSDRRLKISSHDWEPSVPFQPSFFITRISSSESQYDPFLDGIDLPKKSFKFYFASQGATLPNTHLEICDDSISSRTRGPENLLAKNSGKDVFATGTVTGGASVVDGRTQLMPREESASGTGDVKDIPNANKIDQDRNARHQNDGSRKRKDSKLERVGCDNDMEVEQRTDGDLQKDPKVRYFRAALIEFVKELLKPTWREGHISKDAHNTIVKKAVEKVLSTLQSHQIPPNTETVKQYLNVSQPKLAKLVEAYVTKYGKS